MPDSNAAVRYPRSARSPLPLYDRARDLPRLVPLWPSELADLSASGRARLVQRLRRALREERRRGMAGHWAYDLARHAALLRAYGRELDELRRASLTLSAAVAVARGAGGGQSPCPARNDPSAARPGRVSPCRRA